MRVLLFCLIAISFATKNDIVLEQFFKSFGMTKLDFFRKVKEAQKDLLTVVQGWNQTLDHLPQNLNGTEYPLAFMHGMGDSCYNRGMKQITKESGEHLGVYSVCIPTGNGEISDTTNGFFMTMNDNVDEWAKRVKADISLSKGFHAVGFSQGNSVIRGYIQKYNDPPVKTFISVHGTVNGVAGFPNCDPQGLLGPVCKLLAEFLGDLAYAEFVQNMLFQADYFRDPKRYTDDAYLTNSEIAQWNNENPKTVNNTFGENFSSLKAIALIKALKDTMVFPNEAEWFGQFAADSLKTIEKMEDTDNYKQNRFGLKDLHEANKMTFNTTEGNHLEFTAEQLFFWLDNYIKDE